MGRVGVVVVLPCRLRNFGSLVPLRCTSSLVLAMVVCLGVMCCGLLGSGTFVCRLLRDCMSRARCDVS